MAKCMLIISGGETFMSRDPRSGGFYSQQLGRYVKNSEREKIEKDHNVVFTSKTKEDLLRELDSEEVSEASRREDKKRREEKMASLNAEVEKLSKRKKR